MRFRFTIRQLLILTAIIAAGLALICGLHWQFHGRYQPRQIRFELIGWKQADPASVGPDTRWRTIRSNMIEDLLTRYNFDGWTRQQVIDLLGEPAPKTSAFWQWDMIYVLGWERGGALSLDDEALGFKFDSNDRVTQYGTSVN